MYTIKNSFLGIFFLCSFLAQSQLIKIEYEQIFQNSSISLNKKYDFVLTDSLAIYIEQNSKSSEKKDENLYNQKTYNLQFGNKEKSNIYVSKKDSLFFQETFFGEALKIKEDKFDNNWKIIDSTKNIANYKCKLATREFRGRRYFVWYTNDIPTTFGPWKLNGTGGLILEARDEKGEFKLYALKINTIDKKNSIAFRNLINKADNLFKQENELISIAELKKFIEEKNQIILNRIKQQLPRGIANPKLSSDCDECDESLEKY